MSRVSSQQEESLGCDSSQGEKETGRNSNQREKEHGSQLESARGSWVVNGLSRLWAIIF